MKYFHELGSVCTSVTLKEISKTQISGMNRTTEIDSKTI
jgi:hypothetical protein